jgi:hypothetical protein
MLRLSDHSKREMARRVISALDVEQALANPSITYPSADDPTVLVVLGEVRSGRPLKVVVRVDDPEYVITAAWRDNED